VLFGAVTTPPDPEYRSVVVQMRKELDLYANVRPVRGGDADIVIVRENTEGLYSGIEEVGPDRATTLRLITRKGSERIARFACGLAKGRHHLTIGHKANVLKADTLFREVCIAAAAEAGVPVREKFIDALCLDVLQHPGEYDIVVTENMFGDILSDEAAMLTGSIGMLPSASLGDGGPGLFEPVHGSAPDIAGRGVANPLAMFLSAALMLRHGLDLEAQAAAVESAVQRALAAGLRTPDLGGESGTAQATEAVLENL